MRVMYTFRIREKSFGEWPQIISLYLHHDAIEKDSAVILASLQLVGPPHGTHIVS